MILMKVKPSIYLCKRTQSAELYLVSTDEMPFSHNCVGLGMRSSRNVADKECNRTSRWTFLPRRNRSRTVSGRVIHPDLLVHEEGSR